MESWFVTDHLEIEIADVRAAEVHLIGGDVTVSAGDGPARLEVRLLEGHPVEVHDDDRRIRIAHPERSWSGAEGLVQAVVSSGARLLGMSAGQRQEASVTLVVPASTTLDVTTVSASVICAGLAAEVRLKTASGDIVLKDLSELVSAVTVSGDIEARGVSGDMKVKTVSGDIALADGDCRWVEARTVSGDILLHTTLHPSGVYDVGTVSGDVSLRTTEPDVLVQASSVSGSLITDVDVGWDESGPGRRRVRRKLGEGSARLIAKTVSGDLKLITRAVTV